MPDVGLDGNPLPGHAGVAALSVVRCAPVAAQMGAEIVTCDKAVTLPMRKAGSDLNSARRAHITSAGLGR